MIPGGSIHSAANNCIRRSNTKSLEVPTLIIAGFLHGHSYFFIEYESLSFFMEYVLGVTSVHCL